MSVNKKSPIDFSSVLASSVHDMKNSLALVVQSIESLSLNQNQSAKTSAELAKLHYEASRLNTNLMQLLTLYRSEQKQLPINIEEHYIDELFEEIVAQNSLYIEQRMIAAEVIIEDEIAWLFDSNLISHLINDMFINAMRYANTKIQLTAKITADQLEITIEDDGDGYPEAMLDFTTHSAQELKLRAGRTGLGLYFAHMIAHAHKQNDREGEIKLANGGQLGGSIFTLTLP